MTKRFFFPPLDFGPIRAFAYAATITVGFENAGTFLSTHLRDGSFWEIGEDIGIPGINLNMDFTLNRVGSQVIIVGYYDGNAGHTVNVDAYNWGTTSYDTLGQLPDAVASASHTFALDPAHTDTDGSANIRIYHSSPGNNLHALHLDKIHLS